MKLVFATNNHHKLQEIQSLLSDSIELLSLKDINCEDEIPEDQDTLEGNASQKAFYIYNNYGVNCFADDTGLEVEALNGAPGVYSARYAGENATYQDNVVKLLREMQDKTIRTARFRTVVALIIDGEEFLFSGEVEGAISSACVGDGGFGYDPVFIPLGETLSFAQMSPEAKNSISHRGRAFQKLFAYLNNRYS